MSAHSLRMELNPNGRFSYPETSLAVARRAPMRPVGIGKNDSVCLST
ncbi:hypothetical protein Q31b_54880 [Novipirellula aureliae]|uniref:Uncharacterized protein n=1 Tax=Novipirellula aureliae TaxID=2527966 RepID=A0A5C6DF26_9BACT|nr:hypothetical protein Q31b_54880 [Novipirellula aureliae]